ncbi:MAG: hypothetical protein VR72_02870 [Clostridiaceae bacterium BRH_c20a]|nr:MAG: hypothetical protein VR72_02870 [Clostridiaceae bacterium BRH_c20a]
MYKGYRNMQTKVAAVKLGIHERTLNRYESEGNVPPGIVLMMAQVYGDKKIIHDHCANMCPIGRQFHLRLEHKALPETVLELLKELTDVKKLTDNLMDITYDGVIDQDEQKDFDRIVKELTQLERAIKQIKLHISKSRHISLVAEMRTKKEPVLATQAL